MNLIPETIPCTGDYYCTWATQARVRPADMADDSLDVRNNLDEEFLFGKNGVIGDYFQLIRRDLIVLLDDGWDVPKGTKNPEDRGRFGSLMPDAARFPFCSGSRADRLSAISHRIKSLGYKGAGLWIACQRPGEIKPGHVPVEEDRPFWEAAARDSHEAGILYWKVDWGNYCNSADYRRMMTESVRRYAPGLLIEHFPAGMYPPFGKYIYSLDRLSDDEDSFNRRIAAASDYLRTYDVKNEFKYSQTLNRIALLGEGISGSTVKLNVEDCMYLGAGLGCSVGIMRHNRFAPGRESFDTANYAEVARTVRWHRIAPPFALAEAGLSVADELLYDRCTFPPREIDVWPFVAGKTLESPAPSAISRGCPLPVVTAAVKPFVAASHHPETGAYSIAALPRTVDGVFMKPFPADVTASGVSPDAPVGIFGRYRRLALRFDRCVEGRRVYAQDLLSDQALHVTGRVGLSDCELVIPGGLIDSLCDANRAAGDNSDPGIVLRLGE